MNVTSLLNIERFLTFPCYSYEKAGDDSYEVFKITRKDGKFKSQKYLIKSDACSCKGFHHRATCRHVQMLSGDYSAVMAMEKVIATPKDVVIKFLEEFLPEVNLPVDKVEDFVNSSLPDPRARILGREGSLGTSNHFNALRRERTIDRPDRLREVRTPKPCSQHSQSDETSQPL
jgi:hypothetical protein